MLPVIRTVQFACAPLLVPCCDKSNSIAAATETSSFFLFLRPTKLSVAACWKFQEDRNRWKRSGDPSLLRPATQPWSFSSLHRFCNLNSAHGHFQPSFHYVSCISPTLSGSVPVPVFPGVCSVSCMKVYHNRFWNKNNLFDGGALPILHCLLLASS